MLLGLLGCASPPEPGPAVPLTWEQRLAVGRLDQAESLLQAGDRAGARRAAQTALAESRQAAYVPGIGRAMALLAALEGDVHQLQDALALLVGAGDTPGASRARLMLAELAVSAGRADIAVAAVEDALADMPDHPPSLAESAATEARVRHLHAAALRLAGRHVEAAAAERRAALALTLLPDDQQLALRATVARSCGDDLFRIGDARGAVARHAQAADCARRAGDRALELAAITALAADFVLDGQWSDAADHDVRALQLALALQDTAAARAVATHGLDALRALREPQTSARWRRLQAALAGS